jgi:hypothetical protein
MFSLHPFSQAVVAQSLPYHSSYVDDWTNVHDRIERRKMQNRIAQRNYRM